MKVTGDQIDLNLLGCKTLKGGNAKKEGGGDKTTFPKRVSFVMKTRKKKTNSNEIRSNSDC